MEKQYLVLGSWIDKSTNKPKSSIGAISQGESKEGRSYQITETKNTAVIDGTYPVGTILQSTTTFTTNAPTPPASKASAPATPPISAKSTKA